MKSVVGALHTWWYSNKMSSEESDQKWSSRKGLSAWCTCSTATLSSWRWVSQLIWKSYHRDRSVGGEIPGREVVMMMLMTVCQSLKSLSLCGFFVITVTTGCFHSSWIVIPFSRGNASVKHMLEASRARVKFGIGWHAGAGDQKQS